MDDVTVWFLDLVSNYLMKTKIPTVLVHFIVAELSKALTPEERAKLLEDFECFICRHVNEIASAKADSNWNSFLAELENLLDCKDCAKLAPVIATLAVAKA